MSASITSTGDEAAILVSPEADNRLLQQANAPANRTWIILALLMLLSAILRFVSISAPPIWGDEAAVFWRTCGSYRQMTEILGNDGFVPLHYTFYWILGRFVPLTPVVLRFLPTVAAIGMVPAMYFLTRELVNRRTALPVAAFTAVSAHIGWHAQDAKMYSHFWLMCVLCMGSFLWWLRTGKRLAFLSWVASGVCMVGLHSLGWGIIALQPLLMIFRGKPAGRSWPWFAASHLIFLLGLVIIAAGPVSYYLGFNHWVQNIQSRGWDASGIDWIRTWFKPDVLTLIRNTTNDFLFGYDFPPPDSNGTTPLWAWPYIDIMPACLCLLLGLGLFPFPTRARTRDANKLTIAWWRSALCLGAWVLLPPYAFYCASFDHYLWPGDILRMVISSLLGHGSWAVLAACLALSAMYFCGFTWRQRLVRWGQFLMIAMVILLIGWGIALALQLRPPGPLWVTRFLGFVWPGFVIVVFTLLGRLPLAPIRWVVIGILLAVNLYTGTARLLYRQDPPIDLLAADFIAAKAPGSTMHSYAIDINPRSWLASMQGRYYLFLYSGRTTYPNEFAKGNLVTLFNLPGSSGTNTILKDLLASPGTRRIIVWQWVDLQNGPLQPPPMPRDYLLTHLPTGWRCTKEDLYPFVNRWGWWELQGACSRREYAAPEPAN